MSFTPEQTLLFLYSGENDIYSHQVRIVMKEKETSSKLIFEDLSNPSEDFLDLSPYQTLPVLVDKDLVLFDSKTILEYLDERFPFPPLMPVDPENKAKIRQMIMRIDRDWISKANMIPTSNKEQANVLREELKNSLCMMEVIFKQHKHFMFNEYTLLDCALSPLLWRLDYLGIEIPDNASALKEYSERLFERDIFIDSLTEYEEEMRFVNDSL